MYRKMALIGATLIATGATPLSSAWADVPLESPLYNKALAEISKLSPMQGCWISKQENSHNSTSKRDKLLLKRFNSSLAIVFISGDSQLLDVLDFSPKKNEFNIILPGYRKFSSNTPPYITNASVSKISISWREPIGNPNRRFANLHSHITIKLSDPFIEITRQNDGSNVKSVEKFEKIDANLCEI